MSTEYSIDVVHRALIKNARIIEEYGEAYLPTFLRLEEEYSKLMKQDDILKRVADYARTDPDFQGTKQVT